MVFVGKGGMDEPFLTTWTWEGPPSAGALPLPFGSILEKGEALWQCSKVQTGT